MGPYRRYPIGGTLWDPIGGTLRKKKVKSHTSLRRLELNPVSGFCRMKQLRVSHPPPPDGMLVHRKEPPVQTITEMKKSRDGVLDSCKNFILWHS